MYFDQLLDFRILLLLFLHTLLLCRILLFGCWIFQYHPGVKQFGSRSGPTLCPRSRNFALNGTQGKVRVSEFFLGRLIFILSKHKHKLWWQSTTTATYFPFHLLAIVCATANLLLNWQKMPWFCARTSPYLTVTSPKFSWREKSLLPTVRAQLEPCI